VKPRQSHDLYIKKISVEEMGDLANSLKEPNALRLGNFDTDTGATNANLTNTVAPWKWRKVLRVS